MNEIKEVNDYNRAGLKKSNKNNGILRYPSEECIAFLARNFADREANQTRNALDIGCGNGRHLGLLSDYGFSVYGIDYNEDAVARCKILFSDDQNVKQVYEKPFQECEELQKLSYHAVIVYGIFMYTSEAEALELLTQIRDSLADDGLFFADFRTKEDVLFGKGEFVGENTYKLDERAGVYSGLVYRFHNMEEIEAYMAKAGVTIVSRGRKDLWKNELADRHSWWQVTGKKTLG
ncbi:hypothetical protein FACS1894111_00370 [Clostridia bacterium]|nr:hypothetical protein FACS1894111_00370 [Clostridia bacterium]